MFQTTRKIFFVPDGTNNPEFLFHLCPELVGAGSRGNGGASRPGPVGGENHVAWNCLVAQGRKLRCTERNFKMATLGTSSE